MSPYRRAQTRAVAEARETGLVADMVKQFADSYAFLRELCQNSIDAGTPAVEVTLSRGANDEVTTSVADTGSGMTLEIVESALLTLFNSSKDGDESKIGKYGVGFISVLAIAPSFVLVETWREGRTLRTRIGRDHRYVVEELPPREGSGTRVTLEHQMNAEEFSAHAARAEASLLRWCRHARVPIHFSVTDYTNPGQARHLRIDRPLEVYAVTSVSEVTDEHHIVVGPAAGSRDLSRPAGMPEIEAAERFAGFYNRGLSLYESSVEVFEEVEGVRFKISSPKLKHTLSRDDVRRDAGLAKLVKRMRQLVEKQLPKRVSEELALEAERAAGTGDASRYVRLLEAALGEPVTLPPKQIWFPLANSIAGKRVMTAKEVLSRLPWRRLPLTAPMEDELTRALAAAGQAVVLCSDPSVTRVLCTLAGSHQAAHASHVVTSELASTELTATDAELLSRVQAALERCRRRVERVKLVRAVGFSSQRSVIGVGKPGLFSAAEADAASRDFEKGATLLLDTRERAVALARKKATTSPELAAALLARVILLDRLGTLSESTSDTLLERGAGA
jgi:molecular chaperone HtpG